jgi:hypothetical protein
MDNMNETNENEAVIAQTIYVFATAGVARGFEACLNTGTLASCKLDYPPIAIYPPSEIASLDEHSLQSIPQH